MRHEYSHTNTHSTSNTPFSPSLSSTSSLSHLVCKINLFKEISSRHLSKRGNVWRVCRLRGQVGKELRNKRTPRDHYLASFKNSRQWLAVSNKDFRPIILDNSAGFHLHSATKCKKESGSSKRWILKEALLGIQSDDSFVWICMGRKCVTCESGTKCERFHSSSKHTIDT